MSARSPAAGLPVPGPRAGPSHVRPSAPLPPAPTNGDSHPTRPRSSLEAPPYSSGGQNAPPPLSLGTGPPQQGPSVLQILAMGQERNHAADSMAHHPRIDSLVKLGKESEATWLQIGATAETLSDWDRALVAYESALRHNAYSVVALSQVAAICRAQEEFKKAAEYFGRVVGIAPESGDIWGALGHCYLMIDDLKKAYSSYQQALYYMPNPQEPKLWYGIGILYDRYGSLEHAEEAFSSVIRMDPNFEKANEIFFRLGIIYKQQRKSAQSLECFRYILQNPPRPLTEIDIWFQIGHVYEQQSDFVAAKESYERVLVDNPTHAKVLQQLGALYHRARAPFYNPELSVTIITKSLESDANDPFSWYLLGRAYMATNNFGKAYEAYQQAVYRDGKNPAFWCSIGVLYYNINQFHDALDAYSRAIRIHPYLAEVWFNLGALYESCNDQMTDAIDAYQRTLQLDPTNTVVSNRLREIREHQSSGVALSAPPPPKDISPGSAAWNHATNTGGSPSHLAQSGLGPELNSTNARPGQSPSSYSGQARFDGPPPSNGRDSVLSALGSGRPRSTDAYRGSDDRRRTSGGRAGSPGVSLERSPHVPSHRNTSAPGSSSLPRLKSMQDSPRGSPPIPDTRHRRSPPSPRTRPSELSAPEHLAFSSGHLGFHPSSHSHPSSYPREPHESGDRGEREMEWERTSRSSNGRSTSAQARRSSPNPHGPRDSYSAPSGPPPQHHDRYNPSPVNSRPSTMDERGPPLPHNSAPPQQYPYPAHYTDRSLQPFENSANARRYDPLRERSERERERDPREAPPTEEDRRGSSGVRPRPEEPSRAPPSVDNVKSIVPPAVIASPARRESAATKPRRSAAAEGEKRKTASPKKVEGTVKEKKARVTKATQLKSTEPTPSSVASFVEASPRVTPTQSSTASVLVREVDEEYDEGVDALMGLAASATSLSPIVADPAAAASALAAAESTTPPSNAIVSAPITGSSLAGLVTSNGDRASSSSSTAEPSAENPRKRTLASPASELDPKRSKATLPPTSSAAPVETPDAVAGTAAAAGVGAMVDAVKQEEGDGGRGLGTAVAV